MSTGAKPPPTLVSHRTVAEWWNVTPKTVRKWVDRGEFPMEHSRQGTLIFFDRAIVMHRLETGLWPKETRFYGRADSFPDP